MQVTIQENISLGVVARRWFVKVEEASEVSDKPIWGSCARDCGPPFLLKHSPGQCRLRIIYLEYPLIPKTHPRS